ncbi:MAG: hypothetical protein LQ347_004973 [Umbilicaria vellea]|nr:MAG: hypothetical protein LQ347_004973 [Umbilicaria vellea]
MVKREASHAGSWYSDDGPTLSRQLDGWLSQVDPTVKAAGVVQNSGAQIIIAPHAGYAYSGPAAAWAYNSIDFSRAKRIFLLGPSHHFYLSGCALSQCTHYSTPLGDLALDTTTIAELHQTGKFDKMSQSTDEDEHSLEMHLPYLHKMLSKSFPNPASYPPLIPVLVGNTSGATERSYGTIFADYLACLDSVFIVSSDFCHWGSRFNYTYYLPSDAPNVGDGRSLNSRDKPPTSPPIHESIARIDQSAMDAISSGSHDNFLQDLRATGNTVCGRHPIGIVMAALEHLRYPGKVEDGIGRFTFVRYERSSDCVKVGDSSVSYASAWAVF